MITQEIFHSKMVLKDVSLFFISFPQKERTKRQQQKAERRKFKKIKWKIRKGSVCITPHHQQSHHWLQKREKADEENGKILSLKMQI